MLHTRILIALIITSLVSSVSFAQSPVVGLGTDVSVEPVASDPLSELSKGTELSQDVGAEAVATVTSPAPSIPVAEMTPQTEPQLPSSGGVVSANPRQANSQVYSPQRDGLPTLEQRRELRAMPIEERPNRRFHFYGNTVRRRIGR